jgi:hypothetical protein
MNDQRRGLDRREGAANVDVHVHPPQRLEPARAHGETGGTDALAHLRIGRRLVHVRAEGLLHVAGCLELSQPALGAVLVLLAGRHPREVRSADEARLALEQHQREDPLRIRRREEDRHRSAVHVAEQGGALAADSVHHGAHVVHTLLERRDAADAVGRARAALVEPDHAHALRQLAEAGADGVVVELDRREVQPHREDDVRGPRTEDAIGDVEVAAPRVPGFRAHAAGTARRMPVP